MKTVGQPDFMAIIEPIEKRVCETFGVTAEELRGKRRPQHLCEARFAYIAKIRELNRFSSSWIGELLGLDHGTVLHAVKRCRELREIDPSYAALYSRL